MQVVQVGQFDDLTDPGYFAPGTIYEFSYDHDLQSAWCTSNPGIIDFVAASAADVVLRFSGGTIDNGTIKGNQTAIDAPITLIFKRDLLIDDAGSWNVDKAYSDWFECYKNGYYIDPTTFDNTALTYDFGGTTGIAAGTLCGATYDNDRNILQQLLNLSAKHTIISEGIYMVDSTAGAEDGVGAKLASQLTWYKKSGLTLQIDGILKMIPSSVPNFDILLVAECDHINLCGKGKLVGDLPEHSGSVGEGGMCLQVCSTTNFQLEGLTFEQAWGDGVYYSWRNYLTETSSDPRQSIHYWNDIKCLYNRRTGLGFEKGDYIYITNSQFNYTGLFRGTPTQSGVDIEPLGGWDTAQRYCKEVHFDKCVANNNSGAGFRFQRLLGGSIKNSEASNNHTAVQMLNCGWGTEDKVFGDVYDLNTFSNRIVVDGNTFKDNYADTFNSEESDIASALSYQPNPATPADPPSIPLVSLNNPSSAIIINNFVQNTGHLITGGWKDTIVQNNTVYNTERVYWLYGNTTNLKILNNYVLGIDVPEGDDADAMFRMSGVGNLFKDILVKDNIFKYAGGLIIPGSNDGLPMPYPAVMKHLFRQGIDQFCLRFVNNYFDDELWAPAISTDNTYSPGNDGTMTQQRNLDSNDMDSMRHYMVGDVLHEYGQIGVVTVSGWSGVVGTAFAASTAYQKNQFIYKTDATDMFIAASDGISGTSYPLSTDTTTGTVEIRKIYFNYAVIEWQGVGTCTSTTRPASTYLYGFNSLGRRLVETDTGDMIKWDGSAWVVV